MSGLNDKRIETIAELKQAIEDNSVFYKDYLSYHYISFKMKERTRRGFVIGLDEAMAIIGKFEASNRAKISGEKVNCRQTQVERLVKNVLIVALGVIVIWCIPLILITSNWMSWTELTTWIRATISTGFGIGIFLTIKLLHKVIDVFWKRELLNSSTVKNTMS